MKLSSKSNKFWRSLVVSVAIIAIVATGVFIYLKKNKLSDFDPLVKQKLQSLVVTASDGLYRLEFDTLIADIVNSKLLMNNVRLIPDTVFAAKLDSMGRRPADIFTITLKQLSMEGINIDDFLSNKKIDLDVLYLQEPSVRIDHKKNVHHVTNNDTTSVQTVYQLISEQMNRISVKKIFIRNMNVINSNHTKENKQNELRFDNVNMQFDEVLIDSVTQYDTTRFLYAKNAAISLGKLKFPTPDSLYFINLDSVSINASQKTLQVENLILQPRGSKEGFVKKLSFIKERYDITLHKMIFKNIDWWSIVSDESFETGEATITKAKIDVYTDRTLPPNPKSKVGNYPSQMIMKAPLLLKISAIKILDCDISYTELNPKSLKPGKIIFSNCSGIITNITNDSSIIKINPVLKIVAEGKLMNAGKMQADFNFDLNKTKEGVFSVDMTLGPMDGTVLNTVTQPLGLFEIEKLNIGSLSAHVDGTNYQGKGEIKFLYSDMKINILKAEPNGVQKKIGLLSFIANAFIIKDANTTESKTATYTRDIHKSFFNLIWKTILIGILKTIGYEKGADKVK